MTIFKVYLPGQPAYSARIRDEDWETHRVKITRLHNQFSSRSRILSILRREDNFHPSMPQLNARFHRWGLRCYDKPQRVLQDPATTSPAAENRLLNTQGKDKSVSSNRSDEDGQGYLQDEVEPRSNAGPNPDATTVGLEGLSDSPIVPTPPATPPTPGSSEDGEEFVSEPIAVNANLLPSNSSSIVPSNERFKPITFHVVQLPTETNVTDSILRCIAEFATWLPVSSREKMKVSSSATVSQAHQNIVTVRKLQTRDCIQATAEAYEGAHYQLKLGFPDRAICRFRDAVQTAQGMFTEPDLFLLTRLIEIATWSSWKKFPEYEPIVFRFLAASARQQLGVLHPLAIMLGFFSQAAAISPFYPMVWLCIIERIDKMTLDPTAQAEVKYLRIKAYFYLIRVLRNNANYYEAIRRSEELIQLCITVDGVRSYSANRARFNLAVNYCEQGNIFQAMEVYEQTRQYQGIGEDWHDGWVFAVFATSELAQLYEQFGQFAMAACYYEEAVLKFLLYEGYQSSGALLMLKDLKDFYERQHNLEELNRLREQYSASWGLLLAGRLDDQRNLIGCRVTSQAVKGKQNRAWTWTSPI